MHPMPASKHAAAQRRGQQGFTLIEAVIVIVLTGISAAIVSVFIVGPVQAYIASSERVRLVDNADTALRRMGRDLARALPNSVRVTANGQGLELIPTTDAARYSTQGSNALLFGVTDSSFDLVGPGLSLASGQQLVFYNLGVDVPDANAYADNSSAAAQASSNRRSFSNGPGLATTINLNALGPLPTGLLSPPYRVYAVSSPITYRCDLINKTLVRYQGYGFLATQPDPPSAGSSNLLAKGVAACSFSYNPASVAARAALITLRLTLGTNTDGTGETVSLYHALHVDNLP
ncbi:pilus assembly protein MshO [Paucibacter sp. KBW04]|nr:pilus assembly protein MshO [Paucibacter sp. KBW04]